MITYSSYATKFPATLLVALLVLAIGVAGCDGGQPARGGAPAAAGEPESGGNIGAPRGVIDYKLGPGDQLQVAVFGQPDLSGKFEVDGTGNLVLPLLGAVRAEGRTLPEVQQQLIDDLNKAFLVNPKVNLQVLNYRPFYILGEVNKPGSYPYVVGLNVRQAVAVAGGYTRRARASPVLIIRSGKSANEADEVTPDDSVLPGDTVEVERRLF